MQLEKLMSLEQRRREYHFGKLTRDTLRDDPIDQFRLWLEQALAADITDPTAMCLATAGRDGKPWQRIVLLKHLDRKGLVFYTNLGSRKAKEIDANPQVSLHFAWLPLDRQVIIGGKAQKLKAAEVLKYFMSRPRDSQLAAWASQQSSRLSSRQALESQFLRVKEKFAQGDIPLPDFWGGYRVVPEEFEFWQGGERRLHDRFQYLPIDDGQWSITRLAP